LKQLSLLSSVLFLLLLSFAADLGAGHIVGGEFTYSCQGWRNNDPNSGIRVYDVRINMYRDCIGQGAVFDGIVGLDASSPGHITIYRGRDVFVATLNITLDESQPVDVNLGNPCLVLTEEVCQEIGIYEFTVELPVSTEPYTLAYQRCCRNGEIDNLLFPEDIGTTYFIAITPDAQLRCNASPVFNIDPPIAICQNQPFQIDLGATDREGDSLRYRLCDAVVGGGTDGLTGDNQTATFSDDLFPLIESAPPYASAAWRAPLYNRQNQLGQGSILAIDTITGLLSGEPIIRGTFALSVCVEEWSRGPNPILLSATKREFQLTVNLCGNQVEADLLETELDEQGRFFIRQCGPGENTIINESTIINFIDTYDWILEGPDGQITGSSRNLTTNVSTVGVYEGIMILNRGSFASNCIDTAVFLLAVFPDTEPDFEFTIPGCDDEPIDFTDLSQPLGNNTITDWDWDFADGSNRDVRQSPRHRYNIPGTFDVRLSTTDDNQCRATVTKPLSYFPSPRTILIEPDEGFGCVPFIKDFVNLSRPIDDSYIFEWEFGDGGTDNVASPSYVYENSGVYDVYLAITSPTGCFVDTTFVNLVDVRDAPTAGFTWRPEEPTNIFPDFRVFDESMAANARRYLITNRAGELIFTTPALDFDFTLRDTGTIFITQFVTHPSGCVDTITKDLKLRLQNTFFAPNAFSPNGDGLNDEFIPTGLLFGVTEYRLRVWTRWGANVYTTNQPGDGWDGTFDGKQSPGGGYLWDVSYLDVNGDQMAFKGGIVLVR
jgi:gliding motility-associated-like protein